MYFGYIFRAHENLHEEAYQTEIYLVSSFTFYHWRLLNMIANKKVSIASIPKLTLQELCFTQLPDGSTLLHMINNNSDLVNEVFVKTYDELVDN